MLMETGPDAYKLVTRIPRAVAQLLLAKQKWWIMLYSSSHCIQHYSSGTLSPEL